MIFPQVKVENTIEVGARDCNEISAEITRPFITVITAIGILAIIFNLLGIYLLKVSHLNNSFHSQVLKHVSICNILITIASLIDLALKYRCYLIKESRSAQFVWSFRQCVFYVWVMMFYLLTLERFFCCNFQSLCQALTSPKKCKRIIIATWAIALLLLPVFAINTVKLKAISERYLWLVYEGIFLFLFFVTYATAFYRKKQSNQNSGRPHAGSGAEPENQKLSALAAAMLIGFLFFQTVPTIGSTCLGKVSESTGKAFERLFFLCWVTKLVIDPFIYIFLMPKVRRTATNKLKSLRNRFQRNRISSPKPTANNVTQDYVSTPVYMFNDEEIKFITQSPVPTTDYITRDEEKGDGKYYFQKPKR